MRYDTLWVIQEENDLPFVFKETFLDISKSYYPFSLWIWDYIAYVQFWNSGTIHSRVAQFCTSEILCWIMLHFEGCSVYYEIFSSLPALYSMWQTKLSPAFAQHFKDWEVGRVKTALGYEPMFCSEFSTFFRASAFISETFSLGISYKVVFL